METSLSIGSKRGESLRVVEVESYLGLNDVVSTITRGRDFQ